MLQCTPAQIPAFQSTSCTLPPALAIVSAEKKLSRLLGIGVNAKDFELGSRAANLADCESQLFSSIDV